MTPLVLIACASAGACLVACGHDAPLRVSTPPRVHGGPVDAGAQKPKPPEWTYWEPVDAPIAFDTTRAVDLPVSDAQVTRLGAAQTRWTAAPAGLRDAVNKGGFGMLTTGGNNARLGALYAELQGDKTPFVVTLDALFHLAHLALERARAEVETKTLAPALDTVLRRLDARLGAESRDARADLAPAYVIARGLVAVASTLANPAYVVPRELADVVAKEKAKVIAHAGTSDSVLLGVGLDYSAMSLRGIAEKDDARAGYFRAMAWLGMAPLMLAGSGEEGAAGKVSVTLARTHARAALMISRLLDREVDPEAAQAWERIERLSAFIAGPADDITPQEIARAASSEKTDLRDAQWIANVARVDHLRHLAARQHTTRLYDGAGGVRVAPASAPLDGGAAPLVRVSPSVRVVSGRSAPDGELLQAVVFPTIGALKSEHADKPPSTARDGVRALPTGLDVMAWLGASEARPVLHETGDDAYERYDAVIDRMSERRAPEDATLRHASLYASTLDAIGTFVTPSAADRGQAGAGTLAWRRRKLEAGLVAWTDLRHDATTFTRLPLDKSGTADPARTASATVPAFVEPHPEAIAKLVALVRQALRGLTAMDALAADSPARAILTEVDDLVWTALGIALREANDEPLTPQESAALASFPARFVGLESRLALTGSADATIAIDVHTDLGPARVLEEAIGYVDELYMVMAEPRTHRLVLAVGAALPHYEFVQPAALRLTDIGWRARLQAGSPPARDAYAKAYVIEKAPSATSAKSAAR